MCGSVPELNPQDVGTPLPLNPSVPAASYTYDYIIVGGGTAGCVLASRLSEDPSVSVLVIEQGPVADTWASRVPVISGDPYRSGTLASTWWALPMAQVERRSLEVMRGEALGGTSRINSLLYTRGMPGEYNRWKELGCEGWGYDDLEPYFVKSEDTLSHPASKFRGKKGPWQNRQFVHSPYKVMTNVSAAVRDAGIGYVDDLNDPSCPAAAIGPLDIIEDKSFHRASTYLAFLPPKLTQQRKSRLKICTNSIVMRLNIEQMADSVLGQRLVVRGIHFEATNPRSAEFTYFAKAKKEIILCAGALGSPQILMLSGIGPKAHLEEKDVPVLLDVPAVGSYLQDHVGVPLTYQVPQYDSLHQLQNNIFAAIKAGIAYIFTGRGLLSSPFQNLTALLPTRFLDDSSTLVVPDPSELDASIPRNLPDLELMPLANNSTDADIPGKELFTLLPTLIRPRSEGTVRLATSNPRARPDVDLNFFQDPEDYVPLRKGVRLALRLAADVRRSQGRNPTFDDFIVPGGTSDEVVDQFIRKNLRDDYHYTSTCRMGPAGDETRPTVVDLELRVHGVRGLRVCDASIFPEILGTHTMAAAVVAAEKCADMIKASHKASA
ncbi:alcohol oxidase [Cubamyces lactineus]|nr:alcohol oxidase [Cubamyces lactineus]